MLRDPEVYSKHPEPEVGAAMMVCDKFRSQPQALLCNHSQAAKELDIDAALNDNLRDCSCQKCLRRLDPEMVNKDGHVTTVDTRELKWPYLRSLVQRGKKFRLEGDMDEVFRELRESLNDYTAWRPATAHDDLLHWRPGQTQCTTSVEPTGC